MRKGQIFLPIVTIGFLIIMSTFIFLIFTHQTKSQEHFSIGSLQSQTIKNYFESEKIFFYYEKFLEYNEYKAIKEFAENGAIPKDCKTKWKFNSDCEPNFKEYFKEVLIKNLEEKYKEININSEIKVHFTDFNFPSSSKTAKVEYTGEVTIKKQPLINFQELDELKLCIKDNIKEISKCSPESNTGNIYKFKKEIAEILNENLEKEKIFLEFEIDIQNSGLTTSLWN